jgi:hypothetical protein
VVDPQCRDQAAVQIVGGQQLVVTPEWVHTVLWSLLDAARMHARDSDVPEHDALALCLRTLRKAVAR